MDINKISIALSIKSAKKTIKDPQYSDGTKLAMIMEDIISIETSLSRTDKTK